MRFWEKTPKKQDGPMFAAYSLLAPKTTVMLLGEASAGGAFTIRAQAARLGKKNAKTSS
jgi:hypothetical protein